MGRKRKGGGGRRKMEEGKTKRIHVGEIEGWKRGDKKKEGRNQRQLMGKNMKG